MEGTCALVCIAKDEDDYIQEWIDYHLMLGFSDIYIWQNNWRSSVVKETEHVHLRVIDGDFAQMQCYNLAVAELQNKHNWIAFFDVDEFLVINDKQFSDINGFLMQKKYDNVPALCVSWRLFGDNGLQRVETFSQLERFTKCSSKLEETSKVILHVGLVGTSVKFFYNPHCVTCKQYDPGLKFSLDRFGNNKRINEFYSIAPLELNHYRNKTYAEQFSRHYNKPCAVNDNIAYRYSLEAFNAAYDDQNLNEVENTVARDFYRRKRHELESRADERRAKEPEDTVCD